MKKFVAITILLIFTLTISSARAGWLDDWFDQQVSTSPNYFEGQKRGYFTAGSFSARIPTSTDYLISIEKPRLKAGCGGIDIFMGGFSFVNFDYLVQKLQRLIQAAPMVAFQIALNTLSSTLGVEIKDAEKIIDALNNLQLNECAILKPFTTIDLTKDDAGAQFEQAGEAALKSTGLTDLWHSIKNLGTKAQTQSQPQVPGTAVVEGCHAELRNLFLNSQNGVLNYFGSQYGDTDIIPYIRALVGDVVIKVSNDETASAQSLSKPCSESIFEAFKEGKLYKKESITSECVAETGQTLRDKVATILENAKSAMVNKSNPPSGYLTIAQSSPLPVQLMLRYAIQSGDHSIVATVADPVAKGFFMQAYLDIYSRLHKAVGTLQEISKKTNDISKPEKQCSVSPMLLSLLEKMEERMWNGASTIQKIYQDSVNEIETTLRVAQQFENFQQRVYNDLAQKYDKFVAGRAVYGR